MATTTLGRGALAMAFAAVLGAPPARSQPTSLVVARATAEFAWPGDAFHAAGPGTMATRVESRASLDADGARFVNAGDGTRAARAYGVFVSDGAALSLVGSHVSVSGPWSVGIRTLRNGTVDLQGTLVEAPLGTALALDTGEVHLRDTLLNAPHGTAIGMRFEGEGTASVDVAGGRIDGDVVRAGRGALELRLSNSAWQGRSRGLGTLALVHAAWSVGGDSDLGEVCLGQGARIGFDRTQPGFHTLRVGAWRAAADAHGLVLGTRLDAGGTPRRQATDRLLVQGDAVGSTALHVVNTGGQGAPTAGRDGENGPGDGISIVQVGGAASRESFHLAGGYVVVGPWQYGLRAYEPGRSDPAQRLVGGEGGYWDFRLQSVRVGEVAPGAASRAAPRAALAPQVPAYLALGHALFGYGRIAMDTLRPADVAPSREPALRARAFGADARYRHSLSHASHGVDYLRRDRGLQVAGDMVVHAIGETTLRTGFALSTGRSYILPRAEDGRSEASARARGLAWHALLATEGGWELATAYGFTHYRIVAHTPARGEVLPRLRAKANEALVSTAFRWEPSARLIVEAGASVFWQRLRFSRARDRDGIELPSRSSHRLTMRAGARASLLFQPAGQVVRAWSPYLDLRYGVARDGGTSVRASGERLPASRGGRAIDMATGAAFELAARWTASIDASARRGNESGRTVRLGAAWTF